MSRGTPRHQLGLGPKKIEERKLPVFDYLGNPLIRKQLQALVKQCIYRQPVAKARTTCCSGDKGMIYKCNRTGQSPARFHDCMICQRDKAIKERQSWIQLLWQLSRGQVPSHLSLDQILHTLSAPGSRDS